jgi:TusA-related sulfurtransferase
MSLSSIDQFIDLRGVKCPMAFVKARLFLDKCSNKEMVVILIENTPSNEPLPRSIEVLGHNIISIDMIDTLEKIQELSSHITTRIFDETLQLVIIKVQVKK